MVLVRTIFVLFLGMFSILAHSEAFKVLNDISYGNHKRQALDVYLPEHENDAPIIIMVHGGAWRIGDKSSKSVVKNKVDYWVSKGFIFISANYRLLPEIKPVEQAEDVAKVIHYVQKHSQQWGGDPEKLIVMGHSAGAHLVSLVATSNDIRSEFNVQPWLGSVSIDSAAYNVVGLMNTHRPKRFYKKAFGRSSRYWTKASPLHQLSEKISPFLAVCSSKRGDGSCEPASEFVAKAKTLGTTTELKRYHLSHRALNKNLGDLNASNRYTQDVDQFINSLLTTE